MTVGDIYKTSDIIKVNAGDSLSSALSKLTSSHDTAFVFDRETFLGVITPYFAAIKTSYPSQTKVENALVHPPKLELTDEIEKAAQLMMEAKMHYLPVFDKDVFLGIVSARRILSSFKGSPVFRVKVGENNELVTVKEGDTLIKALHLFKDKNISKLLVLTPDLKLKGILSQFDVLAYLSTPTEGQSLGSFSGEKVPQHNGVVSDFYKTNVLTMSNFDTYETALQLITDKHKGSVVVVDGGYRPVEIVTISDLLKLMIPQAKNIPLDVKILHIEEKHKVSIDHFLDKLSPQFKYFDDLDKVTVTIEEHKHGGVIEIKILLHFTHKKDTVIQKNGKNLPEVIGELLNAVGTLGSKQKDLQDESYK